MRTLLKNPAQIVTVGTDGYNHKRGKESNDLKILADHSILIENGFIKDFIPASGVEKIHADRVIETKDKTVLPGLVECHTHTAFAGSRAEEFRKRLSGVSYEEIARQGGGINSTVKAVRESSFDQLVSLIRPRIDHFVAQGITTLEIKSGYGLSFYDEIKLLQVIKYLNDHYPIDIIPTFLGAHTFPPEYKNEPEKYVELLITEMLPYIAENSLAKFCDAFCEKTAFNPDQVDSIFGKAARLGLRLKLHTEQFNSIGGLEVALKYNAVSVDHLEVLGENKTRLFDGIDTVAVLLPGVSFFLDYDYAPARSLIDNGAIVALATDFNPGSSHISNLNFIMSLAALKMKMTIEETISAVTINAAKALGMNGVIGSIELNKKADFAVFETSEYSDIVYSVGKNLNSITVKNGEVIFSK